MMRSILPLSSALALASLGALLAVPATGCASAREDQASSVGADTTTDLADAKFVAGLLGGQNGKCSSCHGVTATKITSWGNALKDVETSCFAPEGVSAKARLDCLRSTPGTPGTATPAFNAHRLGLYAAAAGSDQFKKLFDEAFPADRSQFETFAKNVAMPRAGAPLSADEFARVKDWVLRGMPELAAALAPAGQATTCTPSTTPELAAHLADMKTNGWGARLADASTPMYGCASGAAATGCLSDKLDTSATFGNGEIPQTLRQLHKQGLSSHYWVRSSADGRYVGYGMNSSASIVDLTKAEGTDPINVEADYDPFFLPSNDGFAFAGSHSTGGIVLCRQSLLSDVASAAKPSIGLDESQCTSVGDNVYMSIGSALDGSRYFMTFGSHENDDGGNDQTTPLPAAFSVNAKTIFTPMVNNGLAYQAQRTVTVQHPYEGDMMLSPSSQVGATLFGDGTRQLGYRVRFIKPQETATGLSIQTTVGAEICMRGQKPNFSFDERFVVTHQYVDHREPDQAELPQGSSNIVMADLATGKVVRLTTMKAGQFALYPHFRADGWLYFAIRDMNDKVEYVVATDAALRQ